ncbi:hypothetical protein WN51_11604 [Melipona quadrifasciata]|uniref:Uncharacterized protein n=1 Tax=Melipona quadrifasciata TaxID=166423 RepID=A0A0M9A5D0_9HYME|nr:hypothetical protein WN51_11604 [Melipona quadrifasciata]
MTHSKKSTINLLSYRNHFQRPSFTKSNLELRENIHPSVKYKLIELIGEKRNGEIILSKSFEFPFGMSVDSSSQVKSLAIKNLLNSGEE